MCMYNHVHESLCCTPETNTILLINYVCLVTQSCPTLCDPMECSPPGSSVHGDSPGKNIGAGCPTLLQGIFPTQESNPGLLHCTQILYQLSYPGSPLFFSMLRFDVAEQWKTRGGLQECQPRQSEALRISLFLSLTSEKETWFCSH